MEATGKRAVFLSMLGAVPEGDGPKSCSLTARLQSLADEIEQCTVLQKTMARQLSTWLLTWFGPTRSVRMTKCNPFDQRAAGGCRAPGLPP
jgi:hypothetical protein